MLAFLWYLLEFCNDGCFFLRSRRLPRLRLAMTAVEIIRLRLRMTEKLKLRMLEGKLVGNICPSYGDFFILQQSHFAF